MQSYNEHKENFRRIFSANLRKYMRLYDMNQTDLANRLNVSPQSVSYWCSGKKTPGIDKIDEMCNLFHCLRSDLMEEKNEQKTNLTQPTDLIVYDDKLPTDILISLEMKKMSQAKLDALLQYSILLNKTEG